MGYNTKALRSFPLRSFRTMASQHCRHLYVFCLAARAGVSRQHSGLFLNGLPDRHFSSTAKKSRWETFRFPAGLSRPYFLDGPQEQALLRHTKRSAYCCFLPDLTRFTESYCAGPQPYQTELSKGNFMLFYYIGFLRLRQDPVFSLCARQTRRRFKTRHRFPLAGRRGARTNHGKFD